MANEFDIVAQLGVITHHGNGWTKELNFVSWNGAEPVFDVRDWSPDHKHPARGLALEDSTMRELVNSYSKWRAGNTVEETVTKKPVYVQIGRVLSVVINGYIGTISNICKNGWRKEVNVVTWNGGTPKIDIREWSADHNRMSRGITLTEEEADRMVSLFKENIDKAVA